MSEQTAIIPANGEWSDRITGKYFAVLSSTGAFDVMSGRGGWRTGGPGRRFGPEDFTRLTFRDRSGAANSVTFYAGDVPYTGPTQIQTANSSVTITNRETFLYSWNGIWFSPFASELDNGENLVIPVWTQISDYYYRRKSLLVYNMSAFSLILARVYNDNVTPISPLASIPPNSAVEFGEPFSNEVLAICNQSEHSNLYFHAVSVLLTDTKTWNPYA